MASLKISPECITMHLSDNLKKNYTSFQISFCKIPYIVIITEYHNTPTEKKKTEEEGRGRGTVTSKQ